MGVIGTFCVIWLLLSLYANFSEMGKDTSKRPMKTDWSPETLAAVERKKFRDAAKESVKKHPDNPLTW